MEPLPGRTRGVAQTAVVWETPAEGRLPARGKLPFALVEAKVLFRFVLFAWSGLAGAFTPMLLLSLFWKCTTRLGALAGTIGGS